MFFCQLSWNCDVSSLTGMFTCSDLTSCEVYSEACGVDVIDDGNAEPCVPASQYFCCEARLPPVWLLRYCREFSLSFLGKQGGSGWFSMFFNSRYCCVRNSFLLQSMQLYMASEKYRVFLPVRSCFLISVCVDGGSRAVCGGGEFGLLSSDTWDSLGFHVIAVWSLC